MTSLASFLLKPSVEGAWNSATEGSDLRFLPVPVSSFFGLAPAAEEVVDEVLGGGEAEPDASESAYGLTLPPATAAEAKAGSASSAAGPSDRARLSDEGGGTA